MATVLVVSVLIGYVLGSVPVAYLVAKARGVDIFSVGTGNPGAANTFRSVGKGAGILVFAIDVIKGGVAVAVARGLGVGPAELQIAVGAAAVVGHWYPVFLRFRGGAGLAPAIGMALVSLPVPALIGSAVALLLLICFRNTGYAAGTGFATLFLISLAMGELTPALAIVAMAVLVIVHTRFVHEPRIARGRG